MLARATVFIYGIFCHLVSLAAFLYALGFVGDLYVPESIDSGAQGTLTAALLGDAYRARAPMIFPLRPGRAERRKEGYEYS